MAVVPMSAGLVLMSAGLVLMPAGLASLYAEKPCPAYMLASQSTYQAIRSPLGSPSPWRDICLCCQSMCLRLVDRRHNL